MSETDSSSEKVTVINPAPSNNSNGGNGTGFLIGVIVLIVFAFLFFVYGLPYLRNLTANSGVQVNVPKSIDVNIKQSK
ncbi:MAG TPA: hypothetical protein VLG67_04575 [Candidatus Saccharimonadales bacterium]|nr:hypothetical protein [Candidatus Saccharimonadales bacterium]